MMQKFRDSSPVTQQMFSNKQQTMHSTMEFYFRSRQYQHVVTFFDLGSTISLVSKSYVERNNLKGIPVSYDLITVGGDSKHQKTYLHEIRLKDHEGEEHIIQAFQIDDVCGRLQTIDVSTVVHLFSGLSVEDVRRMRASLVPGRFLVGVSNLCHRKINSMHLFKSLHMAKSRTPRSYAMYADVMTQA